MHLRRLEIQGFKTFANKTTVEFVYEVSGKRGLTAIIGPNGSGKSNIADAIRWVMGEQSMKLLRSKKSEDVIFSGSAKKPRAGFAEVNLILVNDDKPEIDLPEIVITRRLYRDGESEYEINKQGVRLADVVLLLAQCGIGQRTYSVIGQGMVDAVLVASPSERKEFFDEAAGLRPFQLKRHSSMNKLDATKENLKQADALLREIEPRLTSLERQVKRLKEREGIEQELRSIERRYFGSVWKDLKASLERAKGKVATLEADFNGKNQEAEQLEKEFAGMEKAAPVSVEIQALRTGLDALRDERAALRERQIRLESKKEVASAVRAQKPWSPLPLSKIIEEIEWLQEAHEKLFAMLEVAKPDFTMIKELAAELKDRNQTLISKLQQPAPEPVKQPSVDPEIERELAEILQGMQGVAEKMSQAERQIQDVTRKEEQSRSHLFEIQHRLSNKRHEAQAVERELSQARVDMTRYETRRESLMNELKQFAPHLESDLDALTEEPMEEATQTAEQLMARLQRLRTQLEWIGGIDPETVKEYEDTKVRYETLLTQTDDLKQAMQSLETIIEELDKTIKERSEVAFEQLNKEFGVFFKKLFGGGEAALIKVLPEPEEGELVAAEGTPLEEEDRTKTVGIDIQATPPGKRLKNIALLSGGERALTSIALICAIMAINPSPFVVLDEVDAALDDANSRKFAEIVDTLTDRTQFVVVTHNRNTMNKANVLYGVTMGEDGVSQLLSVNLESFKS
jgi:chromosome segregation ATPase